MATFVSDTMTGTDATNLTAHTGEIGGTWTNHASISGTLLLAANRVYGSAIGMVYASGTPVTAEYDVQADLVVLSTAVVQEWEICGRIATGAQTYYMAEYYQGTGSYRLFKRVAGSFTSLGTFAAALSVSDVHTVKLEIRDAAKKVYADGVQRISSADNAITAAGRAGIMFDTAGSASTTGYHLDNFSASDPLSTPPNPPRIVRQAVNRGSTY